jgi:drug/metabolite transporter (DMT)-like permease
VSVPAWIPVTISAAIFQVWRTALQARLRESLSPSGAGFVRYLYALPLDLAMLLLAWVWLRPELPALSPQFLLLCVIAGVAQIVATVLLISAFGMRNFVVGTAYAKTEAAQLVVISVVVFGVSLPPLATAGILLAVIGVLLLSFAGRRMSPGELLRASFQPAALYGLGAGLCFAVTALALRQASLALPAALPALFKALLMLLVTNVLQTAMQGGYMAWRQRPQLAACLRAWRRVAPVGVLSALGSAAWFTGFALTHVALVRGLGQIEILFTFLVGHFYLRERVRVGEVAALVLVAFGVVMIAASEM